VDGGRFHNQVESLIVVNPGVLSETPEDPTSLVAIKGPIRAKLVCEDPLVSDDVGVTGLGDKLPGPIACAAQIRHLEREYALDTPYRIRRGYVSTEYP
jgi:hypothetical protein